MKKHIINCLLFLATAFIICTCNDPVFYAISQEVKPIKPRISGTPTNFAAFDGYMYVASGKVLHKYNDHAPFWVLQTPPGGNILQIASTNGHLYALCANDLSSNLKTVIKSLDTTGSWTQIGSIGDTIQNIFAAGSVLFIMARSPATTNNSDYYTVFYINDTSPTVINTLNTANTNDTGRLTGAAWNGTSYFLSTWDRGVYKIDNLAATATLIASDIHFSGIIALDDTGKTIFLIARDGGAYIINGASIVPKASMGKLATGALAVWKESDAPTSGRLILAGRQDSLSYSYAYAYGYMELRFDSSGLIDGENFIEPGISILSSVGLGGNERYQSTIGKQPLNHLFQAPGDIDSRRPLFASTQTKGVWSYRERSGLFQWNAEGENEPAY